jgi:ABC-type phosphate/phosphonate transport system substrate-binding protein
MTSSSQSASELVLGAVAYDQKVVTIWDGFLQYFCARGLPFDYVLFSNYERQVEALIRGSIHVAWHSPLAWLQTERIAARLGREAQALAMRDTDQDLRSIILVRAQSGIRTLADLARTVVAVGARDSPQATLIPLNHLASHGLMPEQDFQVREFDALTGKHGDHIGGERDAVGALLRGEVDAACILDSNHLAFTREGTLATGSVRILAQTGVYDHCNFTVLDGVEDEKVNRFRELLLGMSYADAGVRPLLDLEGLKAWLPGRVSGYAQLAEAVNRFGTIDSFVSRVEAACR